MPRVFGFQRFKSAAEKFFSPGLDEPNKETPAQAEPAFAAPSVPTAPPFPTAQPPLTPRISSEGQLAIDVFHTPTEVVLTAPVAGVRTDDIEVCVVEDTLIIKGKRCREEEVAPEAVLLNECFWGSFSRSYPLPFPVVAEEAAAQIKDGVLTVRVPKANAVKAKVIKIRDS